MGGEFTRTPSLGAVLAESRPTAGTWTAAELEVRPPCGVVDRAARDAEARSVARRVVGSASSVAEQQQQ